MPHQTDPRACVVLCLAAGTTAGDGEGGGRRRRAGAGDQRSMTWRSFWAAHQAFFRHMTMAAKVGEWVGGWALVLVHGLA